MAPAPTTPIRVFVFDKDGVMKKRSAISDQQQGGRRFAPVSLSESESDVDPVNYQIQARSQAGPPKVPLADS